MSKLFVGRLSDRTSESSLRRVFEDFGEVSSVERKGNYAFVLLDNERSAENAVEKMNGTELDGSNIVVEMARPPQGNNKDSTGKLVRRLDLRILVRGVARGTNWTDLKDWARTAGDVTYTNVFERDGQTFGVVEFKEQDHVDKALSVLEDSPLKGQNVRVEKDDPSADHHNIPPNRGPVRGRDRGGDRGSDRRDRRDSRDRDRGRDRSRDRPRYNDRDDYDRRQDYRGSPPRNAPPPSYGRDRSRSRERGGGYSYESRGPPPSDYGRGGGRDYDNGGGRGGPWQGGGYDDRRGPSPDRRAPPRYYDDRGYDRR